MDGQRDATLGGKKKKKKTNQTNSFEVSSAVCLTAPVVPPAHWRQTEFFFFPPRGRILNGVRGARNSSVQSLYGTRPAFVGKFCLFVLVQNQRRKFVHFPKLITAISLIFEYNITCKQQYVQIEPFLLVVRLTGNYVFEPLDFEKLRCHKVSQLHVFAQAGGSQGAKDRKQERVP